jgi:HEAT repeat protein
MPGELELILILAIVSIVLLIFILLFATIFRRVSHTKKYKELDKQRELYGEKLRSALESGKVFHLINDFHSSPRSIKFYAVEDILLNLINEERYREDVKKLFNRLGYVTFYEKKLKNRNIITRASAIDKLGKMLSASSTNKLINMFKSKNPEIISVTIRSLANIGTTEGLKGILEYLPDLYERWLITRKTIETAILKFGQPAVPIFLEYGEKQSNPKVLAIILDILSHLCNKMSLPLAIDNLRHENAEVRAKALKVIETTADKLENSDVEKVMSLLDDPIWFVRLQAVKALGNMRYQKATAVLGALLLDENWQVRNASAMALTKFKDISVDIFLRALRYKDQYAKESICEEIEKTNFVYRLIENLDGSDRNIYEKSKEILNIMHSLNFSTPLVEYMKKGENDKIRNEISLILNKEVKV